LKQKKVFYTKITGSNCKTPSILDGCSMIVSLPTHLIFRYYLPLRTPTLGIDKGILFRQQEQIKAAWSLLSTLHCLLLPDKVKELGKGPHPSSSVLVLDSFANPRCLSRIQIFSIPDPGSRVPDPDPHKRI
jgi:hypothetical protein